MALRLSPWAAVFRGGEVLFVDADDYYHLRRMMTAAADFPFLPSLDLGLGFPDGFRCPWPPLYDWAVGALGLLLGLGSPSLGLMRTLAALIPPCAGTLTLWLFWRFARRAASPRGALIAAVVAGLLPLPLLYSVLGRPDHHCVENLGIAAALLFCARLFDARDERERRAAAAAAALCLAGGTLAWVGTSAFSGMVFAFGAAELLRRGPRGGKDPEALRWLPAVLLGQVPVLVAATGLNHWYLTGQAAFDAPSPSQPLLAGSLGLLLAALQRRRETGRSRGAAVLAAAGLAAFAYWLSHALQSLALLASASPRLFALFSESQPLLAPFGAGGLSQARAYFGHSLWALPLLGLLYARSVPTPAGRLALCWALGAAALALRQTRYALHLSFPAALLLGHGADWALSRLEPRLRPGWKRLGPPAAALALAALLWPALRTTAAVPFAGEALVGGPDLAAACAWMRENTPPTRSLWSDQGRPEYGVFSLHHLGLQVAGLAQRPALAGNWHTMGGQMLDSVVFFFLDDPRKAAAYLAGRGFRYLLLDDIIHSGLLSAYAGLLGLEGARLWDLVYTRLYVLDGSRIPGFRLVYESPTERNGVRLYKLFELVPGARVRGSCRGSGPVAAFCPVETNQGRRFTYRDQAPCASGRFELRLPYAGACTLSQGRRRGELKLSDSEVVSGAARRLEL